MFEIDSAFQGEEGLEKMLAAKEADRPYALAFVDVRMPPGWDGIETIRRLWEADSDLQVVVCTAYSDYSWDETIQKLGQSDRLLILKKPFDPIEIRQLACALTEKWNAVARERKLVAELRQAEQEQRAYASSLETVNRALETSNMAAARASEMKTDFLVHLSDEVHQRLEHVLERVEGLRGPGVTRGRNAGFPGGDHRPEPPPDEGPGRHHGHHADGVRVVADRDPALLAPGDRPQRARGDAPPGRRRQALDGAALWRSGAGVHLQLAGAFPPDPGPPGQERDQVHEGRGRPDPAWRPSPPATGRTPSCVARFPTRASASRATSTGACSSPSPARRPARPSRPAVRAWAWRCPSASPGCWAGTCG